MRVVLKKDKQFTIWLKWIIGLGCLIFIGSKLYSMDLKEKFTVLGSTLIKAESLIYFSISVLLLFLNWGIEAHKWKRISSTFEPISLFTAFASVMAGICVGNLTPGRIGEFAGRMIFFKPENQSKSAVTHFFCGMSQLILTVFLGLVSLYSIGENYSFSNPILYIFIYAVVLFVSVLLMYFNISWIFSRLAKLSFFRKYDFSAVNFPKGILLELIGWSFLRYFVFAFQFWLLLKSAGVNQEFVYTLPFIAVSFLLTSAIPMISFIEAFVRAAIAFFAFRGFAADEIQLLFASTFIWIINIVIPSVIGYYFLLKKDFSFRRYKKHA